MVVECGALTSHTLLVAVKSHDLASDRSVRVDGHVHYRVDSQDTSVTSNPVDRKSGSSHDGSAGARVRPEFHGEVASVSHTVVLSKRKDARLRCREVRPVRTNSNVHYSIEGYGNHSGLTGTGVGD